MKIKVYNKLGSHVTVDTLTIPDEALEDLSEEEKDRYFEDLAVSVLLNNAQCWCEEDNA